MAEIEILDGVRDAPREEWNALVGGESPFLEWEWLASLEEAGAVGGRTGWAAHPLVAREQGRLVAACPLYLKLNSAGEFVFDWSWAEAAYRAGIDYYPKLLVGVPYTPVSGARFLVARDQDRQAWVHRLGLALRQICEQNRFSSVHVNFCRQDEVDALRPAGFDLRVGVQYHWLNRDYQDFEAYLAAFRSKRRNQIRREQRAMQEQGVRFETMCGDDIPDELFGSAFDFYLATVEKKYYGRQYLDESFFQLLRDRFRHRLCFILAFQGDEPIAGTFNVQKGDALYGRYWGATRELRYLHFNVCYYQAVAHCIRLGLRRFEPGAGGEYKQVRGFDAQPTRSMHYIVDPRLRQAVERYLRQERAEAEDTIEWIREHSALKERA